MTFFIFFVKESKKALRERDCVLIIIVEIALCDDT